MGKLLQFRKVNTKVIECPCCNQLQTFEQDEYSGIWFQIAPYCCAAMEYGDDTIWNKLLDERIAQ